MTKNKNKKVSTATPVLTPEVIETPVIVESLPEVIEEAVIVKKKRKHNKKKQSVSNVAYTAETAAVSEASESNESNYTYLEPVQAFNGIEEAIETVFKATKPNMFQRFLNWLNS